MLAEVFDVGVVAVVLLKTGVKLMDGQEKGVAGRCLSIDVHK